MKLQVAFDLIDLEKALDVAAEIEQYADIIEIGSLLIYKHGDKAIKSFREKFPKKIILTDGKIVDRSKDSVALFAQAGTDWITVMAGTSKNVIHTACTIAHELGKKIMLDLLDASSLGQSALEAQSLGVDALLFHKPADENEHFVFLDSWDMVKGNTQLPVFVSTHVSRETIAEVLSIAPAGIVIGRAITHAENPAQEAAYFASIMHT